MNKPTLLNDTNTCEITPQVFSDLQLTGLLSENAIKILRSACDAQTIRARQEFFTALQDAVFLSRATELRAALSDLEHLLRLWRMAERTVEAPFLSIKLTERYLAACNALRALRGYCTIADLCCSYFETDAQFAREQRLTDTVGVADKLIAEIASFDLTVYPHMQQAYLSPVDQCTSYTEQVRNYAQALGFSPNAPKTLKEKSDPALASAYTALYPDQIKQLTLSESPANDDLELLLALLPELDFYLEIHALTEKAKESGIAVCCPRIADQPILHADNAYDISLLTKECEHIVPNDIDLTADAPFYFLTGANGGGKTTYLRCVGINLLFFLGGCNIFARDAVIYPFDRVLTHFPQDERFADGSRFDNEVCRVNELCTASDGTCVFLFNETFGGTQEVRGTQEAINIANLLTQRGGFGIFVTHFHAVAQSGLPLLNAIADEDSGKRTFKICKYCDIHSSFAADILKKYHLDRTSLAQRRSHD